MTRMWQLRHKVTRSYDEESGSSYDHSVDGYTVSRDERNEYHGVTVDRANKILEALGAKVHSTVELPGTLAA